MDIAPNPPVYQTSKRNKKIGLWCILTPLIVVSAILLLFSTINILVSTGGVGSSKTLTTTNFILGFLGIIAVISIPIGIIISIIFFTKKELVEGPWDERSGNGANSTIPPEINRWNWGAAGLTWIWGIYHGVWSSFLIFLPFFNIVLIFILGMNGSKWAWQKSKWKDVETFQAAQNKWKWWGRIFFIITMLGFVEQIYQMNT